MRRWWLFREALGRRASFLRGSGCESRGWPLISPDCLCSSKLVGLACARPDRQLCADALGGRRA